MDVSKVCSPCLNLVLGTVSVVLRSLEISFALFILFYVSSRIPAVLLYLLNFLLGFINLVASPAFAFCLCNVIIAAVLAKASTSAAGDEIVRESKTGMVGVGDDLRDHWTASLLLSDTYDEEGHCQMVVEQREEKFANQLRSVVASCEVEETESIKGPSDRHSDEDCFGDEDEGTMCYEKVPMTNDELKRRVEDFIARELRFRREESLAIVLPSY